MVKHVIPSSLEEVLSLLQSEHYQLIAGGTDLMIQKRSSPGVKTNFDKNIIFIANLSELRNIYETKEAFHIGSMVTLDEARKNKVLPLLYREVLSNMASANIRHLGTVGGNVCNASPAGDSLVPLYLMDAKVKLIKKGHERIIPINDFILGVRKTCLEKDELLTEIIIPKINFTHTFYQKVGSRKADSIAKISFAGAYTLKDHIITDLRLAFGSVSKTIVRSTEAEKHYQNIPISCLKKKIDEILDIYKGLISPIDDQRSSKEYREIVALNLAKKFLESIKEGE